MKIERTEPDFKPITITIESEEELCVLKDALYSHTTYTTRREAEILDTLHDSLVDIDG